VKPVIIIGIVIAAFFVGLSSTYLIFHTGGFDVNAGFNMMDTPQHAQEMGDMMNINHNFTMEMMSVILEDPALQLQLIGHMAENPEAMKQFMTLVNPEMIMTTMSDSNQIQLMEDMMADMMERMKTDPELEQLMIEHMKTMSSSGENMMDSEMMNP